MTLKEFLNTHQRPTSPIEISKGTWVVGADKFIKSHTDFVRHNLGKAIAVPYLERLRQYRNTIENGKIHNRN